MIINNYYEIEILANKTQLDLGGSEITFQLSDSIHRTYPRLTFWLKDTTAAFQEYLATTEGLVYDLYYGIQSEVGTELRSRYVITQDSLSNPTTPGILNGDVKIELLHEYYNEQTILSSAYTDRISLVVRELAEKYPFSNTDINDTGNQNTWYQLLCTDEEFMRWGLLPNCFSNNAFASPFFMFIGVDNVFHWNHYSSLTDQSPVDTLVFVPDAPDAAATRNQIRSLRRVHVHSPIRRRSVTQLDYTNGELIEEEDSLLDYPSTTSQPLPLVENSTTVQDYLFQGYTESSPSLSENDMGYRIHTMRDGLFLDRFKVEVPFHPALRAGRTVNLEIRFYLNDSQGEETSFRYRNKFLIEESQHYWNGEQQQGFTEVVISRKTVNVPNSYLIRNQLMGA